MKKLRLMIPGPIELDPEVLAVMAEPMVAHYGEEWTAFYKETLGLLQKVFQTEGDVFLFPGSGSAGLDAALGSTVFPNRKILIPQNGFFGERLAEIARTHTPNVQTLRFPIGQPIELEQVEEALVTKEFKALAVTHCETSTGMLNPIQEIAEICRRRKVLFIVDAISSLAIEPLEMDTWGIDLCVSASQKGLESPPGLGVVAVSKRGWKEIKRTETPGWYLNLKVWKEYEEKWGNWHPHPVTQAVNNVRALQIGLKRILNEGLENRFRRHCEVTKQLHQGLRKVGFRLYITDRLTSHGVTAVIEPEGKAKELLTYVRNQHHLMLAGSLGELKDKVFRIGHMGPGATKEAVETVLYALDKALSSKRQEIE